MKELELNSDHKTKVAYLNETTSETFQDLTPILFMPVLLNLALFQLALSPGKAELGLAQPPLVSYSTQLHNKVIFMSGISHSKIRKLFNFNHIISASAENQRCIKQGARQPIVQIGPLSSKSTQQLSFLSVL